MTAGSKRKSYLTRKATSGPSIKVTGGSFDKSDIFIGVAGLFVIAFVVILGGSTAEPITPSQIVSKQQNTVLRQQQQQRPIFSSSQQEPLDSTSSAKNNMSDDDNVGHVTMKEIHGQKFRIGESLTGDHKKEFFSIEHNAVDEIQDQAKKVKQDLDKAKENQIADLLDEQKKKVKKTMDEHQYGIPYFANVDDGQTDDPSDPFDSFSEPGTRIQTKPNIDYTGFGHTKYTTGNVKQYDRVFYPTDGDIFVYHRAPINDDSSHDKRYGDNESTLVPYATRVEQNKQIQARRNKEGFSLAPYTSPISMKRRYPNNDFLPNDRPNFFNTEHVVGEREIGQELGITGHTFDDGKGNIKSGIGNTKPAHPNMPIGQGSGAFNRGESGQANMRAIKAKVKTSVQKIIKLFDRLFSEELFPDAVVDVQGDGNIIFVRDGNGGRCISLARYYEYVQSSIRVTIGLGHASPLSWAKNIDLNFESIEKNKIPLRAALTESCNAAGGYTLNSDKSLKTEDGKTIEIIVPWDKDQSILVNHVLKLGEI